MEPVYFKFDARMDGGCVLLRGRSHIRFSLAIQRREGSGKELIQRRWHIAVSSIPIILLQKDISFVALA